MLFALAQRKLQIRFDKAPQSPTTSNLTFGSMRRTLS